MIAFTADYATLKAIGHEIRVARQEVQAAYHHACTPTEDSTARLDYWTDQDHDDQPMSTTAQTASPLGHVCTYSGSGRLRLSAAPANNDTSAYQDHMNRENQVVRPAHSRSHRPSKYFTSPDGRARPPDKRPASEYADDSLSVHVPGQGRFDGTNTASPSATWTKRRPAVEWSDLAVDTHTQ